MIKAVIFDWAGTTIDYGSFAPVKAFIDGFALEGIKITSAMARKPMGLLKIDHTRAIASMLNKPIDEETILKVYQNFEEILFKDIENHCEVKEHVKEAVIALHQRGIKIGSTTGYTSQMMASVLPKAKANGYQPDFCVAPDEVGKGRPFPYMIWENMRHFNLSDPREVVKVGDTLADIAEAKSANCWSVGIILGSSELGYSKEEFEKLTPQEIDNEKERVRASFYQAGADYIIDDMSELLKVIDDINRKLKLNKSHKLLTPGPLTTKSAVKQAMLTDHCTWDDEYKNITKSVMSDITSLAANDDYATILLQGSGSYAVEAMLCSLIKDDEKMLLLVNGEYGKRMVQIAKDAKKNYMSLEFKETEAVDVMKVEELLKEHTDIKYLVLVHCETTTGIINPLEEVANLAKKYNKELLVDAMSSFGAYPIDMAALNISALASSANKCLEGLPGLAFVIAKKQLVEKSKGVSKSHSLDLYDQYLSLYEGGGKFRFTSPTNILLALRQALDEHKKEGGLIARSKRYQANHKTLVEGLSKLGIMPIIKEDIQSYIITTFLLGELDFNKLYHNLKNQGFIIYPGKLTKISTFRIGNIGNVYPSDMKALVDTFKANSL